MHILVTGAAGLLGSRVVSDARARGHLVTALAHSDLDVMDQPAVAARVDEARPEAVIHCAAYTAVDRAETEEERARAVNRDGTRNVAEAASRCGARFVYVSTDYVFDGRKRAPYLPDDSPNPLSVYGRTKLEGERAAREAMPEALIVRTSWLYGAESGFVPAILRRAFEGLPLRVVDDQRGRPTWAPHAAAAILDLVEGGATGIWHAAGSGDCTWLELAREAVRRQGLASDVEPISTAAFGAPAPRPPYSVLDLKATERRLGRKMPDWREGLAEYFIALSPGMGT